MKKVALYLRVSSEGQETNLQRDDLLKYCADNKLDFDIYEEKVSGLSLTKRTELLKLRQRFSEYAAVIVWKSDRWARNSRDLLNLIHEMEHAGCAFISLKDPVDLTSHTGRFHLNIQAAVNEFEVGNTKMRQKAGIAAAKARGVKFGPKPLPIDWDKFNNLKAKGISVRQIAKELAISKSALYERMKAG